MLVWLSVCSEVQVICIWSSWCHCIPKLHHLLPHLNPAGFTFLVPTYPGCQCLLPDSGFDHPDYPWSSCCMNTICENKTQLSTADKSTALRFVILQTRSVMLSFRHHNNKFVFSYLHTLTKWHCPHATAAAVNQWDRQTDGQTLDSFINPAPHTRAFQFSIWIDSIHYANWFILQKKSAFLFTSCHAVFLLIYCIVSAKKK